MITLVRAAGKHLLGVLKAEKAVNYSRFYNAVLGADEALADAIHACCEAREGGESYDVRKTLVDEGHLCVEWAAWQLEGRGLVALAALEGTKLIDGGPDYSIALTPMGEEFIKGGGAFGYHDPRCCYYGGKAASEWLVWFLDGGGSGQHLTLNEVMEFGESDGDVEVTDDCGNAYPYGSPVYAWAFEVALWHHARSGNVVPDFDNDAQKAAWAEMMGRKHLFPRPDMAAPHPLWSVPFRLAPGVNPDEVGHVGQFGGE